MYPQSTPPYDEKLDIENQIRKVASAIMNKLENLDMNLKSTEHTAPNREEASVTNDHKRFQLPTSTPDWEYSNEAAANQYENDFYSTVPVEEEYDYDNTMSLNPTIKTNDYKVDYPEDQNAAAFEYEYERDQIPEMFEYEYEEEKVPETYYNDGERFPQPYTDIAESKGYEDWFVDNNYRILPTETENSSVHAVENNSGVWHTGYPGFLPPNTTPVAHTSSGVPLFVGRVNHEGHIVPATVDPEKGLAYFSWNGKVYASSDYVVYEIHNFAWEDESSDRESLHAFPVGQTSDGTPLYLGRVYVEGMGPWVGRVHRDEKHVYIAFRGNELRMSQPYEVFVTYSD